MTNITTVEIEDCMLWTGQIAESMYRIYQYNESILQWDSKIRDEMGIGMDAMIGGILCLSIASGLYLTKRIKTYDNGVFSYDHLEANTRVESTELPWVLFRTLTDEQWWEVACNFKVPENLNQILDEWLAGPEFAKEFQKAVDGDPVMELNDEFERMIIACTPERIALDGLSAAGILAPRMTDNRSAEVARAAARKVVIHD